MKKKLFLGALASLLVLNTQNTYALEENLTDQGTANGDVTVGEITEPVEEIYDIDIYWSDLTFNWVYDENADVYRWESDDKNYFTITDRSVLAPGKHITVDTEFTAEDNYSFTTANFSYDGMYCSAIPEEEFDEDFARDYGFFMTPDCSGDVVQDPNPSWEQDKYYSWTGGFIGYDKRVPEDAIECKAGYVEEDGDVVCAAGLSGFFQIDLQVNNEQVNDFVPEEGDKIGTITITIGTEER